jgi:glycosyltransferase involved in cell wall biosynthesis
MLRMSLFISVSGWILFVIWVVGVTPSLISMLWRSLDSVTARLAPPATWPALSIIVPARDEEKTIDAAMRSKLAIDYPKLEFIAVNDRSQDATGILLDHLAAEDRRLSVVHLDSLAEGWLGKSHAMHVAASRATGDYLLFTDADVFFAPDLLRKAVTMCEARGLDHLALAPRLECSGFFEKAVNLYFVMMLCIASQPWLVRTGWRMSYVGVGAFALVRRTAYSQCGGHTAIRLDVLDDVKLGKLIKQTGLKQDVVDAGEGVRVRWQEGYWGVVRGLEKNGFAVFDYSLVKLTVGSIFMFLASLFPYLAIVLWPNWQTVGFVATVVFIHAAGAFGAWRLGFGAAVSAGLPVAAITLIFTMWRSAFLTLLRRGVQWRDTFYPLNLLRENVY